ncbi:MAG: cytochrome c biogenesis protein CcsA [Gammaproteobacteria bacterium]|jgi:ABC-type uncharacterized transport system permease subunit|nr:cytochrome c biogenesis protein CcsA [Gammaproteobacteria bacterium]MBT5204212.1 cytochrome c biogenesis protein CcsA [Gammaproteobacteria bacterium]MBT5603993.1 cytochrome c biogenesis protein CcsA [Gammaproteobacteria bacterium]
MQITILGLIAIATYLISIYLLWQNRKSSTHSEWLTKLCSLTACSCHGFLIWLILSHASGINLGLFTMLCLMAMVIASLIVLSSLRKTLSDLAFVVFPLSALSIIMLLLLPDTIATRGPLPDGLILHIVLSVIAYSFLSIAALQAVALSLGDYYLRQRQSALAKMLPPIQTLDTLLFRSIWYGLTLLTLSIGSGFLFLESADIPGLVHHTVITAAAWVIFVTLLWGRYYLGWRGTLASRWTLAGFILLVVGYFGSKIVIEMILH